MDKWIPILAVLAGFGVTALLGVWMVPFLHKLKFGQTILDIGPKWHKNKQGTPTMGGIMIAAGVLLATGIAFAASAAVSGSLWGETADSYRMTLLLAGLGLAFGTGFIGFIDDYIKVVKKRNLGLTARQKTMLQLLVAAAYLLTLRLGGMESTWVPFLGDVNVMQGWGLLFWPVALVFIYGFTNAVNLTDGIDGLASSVTLVVATFFILAAGVLGQQGQMTLAAALAGACVGFLVWNSHPAKVFMGDTGSMFLGGMVVGLSFGIGRPILLIFAGIIYLLEAMSVVLQVTYYKKTKKRLFKMSPIHHHFEMSGWSEEKIVFSFSAAALVGCVIAFLPIALRW
ncbi:MAG: phospho-N-acetylmuramoyl-pentapeptide-transferase [Candidatus Howiella sp.]|jgi:phospho-N-acetylmuramoyl-pentapeptide-transferase